MIHHIHYSTDHYVCIDCGIRFKSVLKALEHVAPKEEVYAV
jgi:hypothetical protein